jgi:hypothetical protein
MNRREQQIHIAIVDWIKLVSPSTVLWHTPNGGLRTKREAALLKAMGTLAGVPDLIIMAEPPGPCMAFLEVKAPGEKLSVDQLLFRHRVEAKGALYEIVHSIDEVRAAFRAWLVPTREAVAA